MPTRSRRPGGPLLCALLLLSSQALASDTIRRFERGEFSPSLLTVRAVARGLDLSVASMFVSFDLVVEDDTRDLVMLVTGRGSRVIGMITQLVRAVLEGLEDQRE